MVEPVIYPLVEKRFRISLSGYRTLRFTVGKVICILRKLLQIGRISARVALELFDSGVHDSDVLATCLGLGGCGALADPRDRNRSQRSNYQNHYKQLYESYTFLSGSNNHP
jgi:hypothetical protein